jgi:hypothetical protein
MKQIARIILIVLGTSMLIGLSACLSFVTANPDPEQVSISALEIADFDLPVGYHVDFSTNLMGYLVLAYSRGAGPSHLYLIQSDKESDGEKLAQVLDEVVVGSGAPETRMTVIETHSVSVRGQETTLVISDYVNSEGVAYRQAAVAFPGNGGPALLVFSERVESWEQATVDTLLASIH